jgi:hypothetical protein
MPCVLVLLMAIDVVVVVVFWGVPLPSFYMQGGWDYKESPRISYNCSPSRTLSLVFLNS